MPTAFTAGYSKASTGYRLHSRGQCPLPLLPGILKPPQAPFAGLVVCEGFRSLQVLSSLRRLHRPLASQSARASVDRYYRASAGYIVRWPCSPRGLPLTGIIKPPQATSSAGLAIRKGFRLSSFSASLVPKGRRLDRG
jgi:hypothetical protein